MNEFKDIIPLLPDNVQSALENVNEKALKKITEIRIRRNMPLVITVGNSSYFMTAYSDIISLPEDDCIVINDEDFDRLFYSLCDYSVYANSENLKKGFITLKNGARVGVASTAVYEQDRLISVKNITGLNIRIPRQVRGCSTELLNFLYAHSLHSVIVTGCPGSGKTTLLRDMAYNLSEGFNNSCRKVVIIDERNEFAGKRENSYTLDVGANCDVLTSFSKADGIEIATRSLSPDVIVCDEISKKEEIDSIAFGFSCGVKFLLSIHIGSKEDLHNKSLVKSLIGYNEFEYIILLDGHTFQYEVIDIEEIKNEICRRDSCNCFK